MLPGVLVVGAAQLAYPEWFRTLDFKSWHHLIVLAVVTLAIGNTWFALNRYGLHQLVDYFLYLTKSNGPARTSRWFNYLDDLGLYAYKSLHTDDRSARAREHVAFRASTVLLILTLGELAILFGALHSNSSVFVDYSNPMIFTGVAVFTVGVWQMIITRHIDYYVVNPPKGSA